MYCRQLMCLIYSTVGTIATVGPVNVICGRIHPDEACSSFVAMS